MTRCAALILLPVTAFAAERGFDVGAEVQMWQPHVAHAPFAASIPAGAADVDIRDLDYGYDLAFAVNAAYRLDDGGRIVASYWRCDSEAEADVAGPQLVLTGIGGATVDGPGSVDGRVIAWTFDVGYVHETTLGGWAVEPGIGLRYLDLMARQDGLFQDSPNDLGFSDRLDDEGYGPRLTLGVERVFAGRWRAFAAAAYALLLTKQEDSNKGLGTSAFNIERDDEHIVTTIDLRLGLAWIVTPDLEIALSWTIGEWQDALGSDRNGQVSASVPDDLSYDAFALGASYRFGG